MDKILAMAVCASKNGDLKAISLTSGVAESPEKEVEYMVEVVRTLARHYDLPIGVFSLSYRYFIRKIVCSGCMRDQVQC